MKSIALILLLLAMSKAQKGTKGDGHEEQLPCPTSCKCIPIRDHQNPEDSYIMANCSSMPDSLDHNILSLKVVARLSVITKRMIAGLGKDLRMLDLSNCHINCIEKGTFSSAQQLQSIVLSHNELTEVEEGVIACHALKELYLDGNDLDRIDENAFQELKNLEYLYLQQNKLERLPAKLPSTLVKLDVSQNAIKKFDIDISKMQVQYLDLCGNNLDQFRTQTGNHNIESLCIEGEAINFKDRIDITFPFLTNLTLMASKTQATELNDNLQKQLRKLSLTSLAIVSFHVHDLNFLPDKLVELTLRNITVKDTSGIFKVFKRLTTLNRLYLDESPRLVATLFKDANTLSQISRLNELSLRKTRIVSIGRRNVPQSISSIDVSENPLRCDCTLVWAVEKGRILQNPIQTKCSTPTEYNGQKLTDAVNPNDCSNTKGDKFEQQQQYAGKGQEPKLADHTVLYIILGTVLLILVLIGITLAIVLSVMKRKRRKCQIVPEVGDAQTESTQQQMKQSSSSDMLIEK